MSPYIALLSDQTTNALHARVPFSLFVHPWGRVSAPAMRPSLFYILPDSSAPCLTDG